MKYKVYFKGEELAEFEAKDYKEAKERALDIISLEEVEE